MPLGGRADTAQFKALVGKTSQLDAHLRRALRKRLREAATPAVAAAKQAVLNAPTTGDVSTGLRQDIADGIKVSILTGNTAGVVIKSGAGNDLHPKSIVRAFDKAKGWRHPVYGNDVYVNQPGHPYFAAVISKFRADVTKAVEQAMTDAAKTLQ